MKKSLLLLFIIQIIFAGCNISKKNTSQQKMPAKEAVKKLETLAKQKYGDNSNFDYNSTKEFVVCFMKTPKSVKNPHNQLRFFIYDFNEEKIIHENAIADGKIQWHSTYAVKVDITPQILGNSPRENQRMAGYIFDVKSKRKKSMTKGIKQK